MEYWSIGVLEIETQYSTTPLLQHSSSCFCERGRTSLDGLGVHNSQSLFVIGNVIEAVGRRCFAAPASLHFGAELKHIAKARDVYRRILGQAVRTRIRFINSAGQITRQLCLLGNDLDHFVLI